jgi:very-short-patch-repair endonuclease
LICLICNPEKGTTRLERKVQNVLSRLFPNVEVFPQCRALFHFPGPIDFCLLFERVLIQVDGDSHSGLLRKRKAQRVDQLSIDEDCNTRATQQGWHMLRIHKDDVDICAHVIQDVLLVAKAARHADQGHRECWMSSVTWSETFGRERELYIVKGGQAHLLTS